LFARPIGPGQRLAKLPRTSLVGDSLKFVPASNYLAIAKITHLGDVAIFTILYDAGQKSNISDSVASG
jgi:hypothetical protein